MPDVIDAARNLLAGARRVLVLTGAGVSRESGVPTFRGSEGLWKSFRPEELATPEAFERDPELVWGWYTWRRRLVAPCRPNAAHRAIARLAAGHGGVSLATQNVDGLHELAATEAGAPPPLALHGSLFRSRCTRCDHARDEPRRRPATADDDPDDAHEAEDYGPVPTCPRCGALLRPDVVWFGESLDPELLGGAWRAAEGADVCLVVGTSGVVQPAASLAAVTRQGGGAVVEVNPEPTPLTPLATVSIRAGAAATVPAILGGLALHDPETSDAR